MKKMQSIIRILYITAFLLLGSVFFPFSHICKNPGKTVYCLADVSRSITPENLKNEEEIINRFQLQARETKAVFKIITFAESPSPPKEYFSPVTPTDANRTNPESALLRAAEFARYDTLPEILLISDGGENIGDLCHAARRFRLPISVIPLPPTPTPEVSIAQFKVPFSVRRWEPFYVIVTIFSNTETKARLSLYENETLIDEKAVPVQVGKSEHTFFCRSESSHKSLWKITLNSDDDTIVENNAISAVTEILPPNHLLFVSLEPSELSLFIEMLNKSGFTSTVISPEEFPENTDSLKSFDIIFLSDIPAESLNPRQFRTLDDNVRNRGSALFVTGGPHSFAVGQYAGSDLESILPVRADYTPDQSDGNSAICFLIDRSGSTKGEKLRYAKSALTEALRLLSGKDRMGVIAFDQSPEVILPLQYALITPTVRHAVENISSGGGTDITPAIRKAEELLNNTSMKKKHIILLSDGISSPIDDKELIDDLRREKITLSIILSDDSPQKNILRSLAEETEGRFYQSTNPSSIPRLFINETERIRLAAIEETEAVPVKILNNDLTALLPTPLPPLKGYMRTEAKNGSNLLLAMPDHRPLLVQRRLGLGSVTVWTSDITPRWSAAWLSSDEAPLFWSALLRRAEKALPQPFAPVIESSPEYYPSAGGEDFLKKISEITNGQFNPTPEDFFKNRHRTSIRLSSRRFFLFAAFFLFLTASLLDRLSQRRNEHHTPSPPNSRFWDSR
ncbi:MAG: VWA domain-containing protein [Thermoguttaceae bacterium]|nr:VWA domain-containing protein [Thermoguttaceae bacterium]